MVFFNQVKLLVAADIVLECFPGNIVVQWPGCAADNHGVQESGRIAWAVWR